MALSKKWKLIDIISIIRVLTDELIPGTILDAEIIDIINLSLQEIAKELTAINAPDYGVKIEKDDISADNNFIDVSGYSIDRIVKVSCDIVGIVPARKYIEFDNLKNISHFENSIFYSLFGEKIYLFIGENISTPGKFAVYFYRQPEYMANDEDYIDIKDIHISLVIAKAKQMIYEKLKLAPPESLTNLIQGKIQNIKKGSVEDEVILKNKGA